MHHSIIIGDESLPILIRKHPRSRRMVIRYQPIGHHLSLTLPRYVSIRKGLQFVEEKRLWIEHELLHTHRHVPFEDGQVIPYQGVEYKIVHRPGRGIVILNEVKDLCKDPSPNAQDDMQNSIIVPGEAAFLSRRLTEFLKRRAREEITALAAQKAKQIDQRIKKISLRDTSSRWGSCSHDGNLSFSWRLILAPPEILDYLVSHEVAHLAQHNHSPAFWSVVARLHPEYKKAGLWLKRHGQSLYAYR